jgi:hypothetical protein
MGQMRNGGIGVLRGSAVLGVAALACMAGFACGGGGQAAAPSPSPITSPMASSGPTPSARSYASGDLPPIVLTNAQMAGWQTATRQDLTGAFDATSDTNPQENPKPVPGVQSGFRQTIGNPGTTDVNVVRTILELFAGPSEAQAALAPTVSGYEAVGFTEVVNTFSLGLGADIAERSGSSVPIAPQFAQGTATKGVVFVWRSGNLLLIQVVGGDSDLTLDAATKWIQTVIGNAAAPG